MFDQHYRYVCQFRVIHAKLTGMSGACNGLSALQSARNSKYVKLTNARELLILDNGPYLLRSRYLIPNTPVDTNNN